VKNTAYRSINFEFLFNKMQSLVKPELKIQIIGRYMQWLKLLAQNAHIVKLVYVPAIAANEKTS